MSIQDKEFNKFVDNGDGTYSVRTSGAAAAPSYFATRVDEASASVTYVGKAVPGTLNAQALWQITRITVAGAITSIEFAGGTSSFDKVWNDRAGLTYT